MTLALSGYSSHQGRVLAELYGETLEPDLAVIYFGWNDHWRAYQTIDSQKVVTETRSVWASGFAAARGFRLGTGARKPFGFVLRVERANRSGESPDHAVSRESLENSADI